jgi:cell wall-associated NlpC family hydrolase
MLQQGVSEASAAGILANIQFESGFDAHNATGDGGTSGGLFQHHAGRWAALKEYARSTGREWTDWTAQVDFALQEARGMGINLNATDPAAAAREWTIEFERPSNPDAKASERAAVVQNYMYGDVPEGAGSPDGPSSGLPSGEFSVDRFLDFALRQEGDAYQLGEAPYADPDPDFFDCSELVEWAAAQAGVPGVGESSYEQYLNMKEAQSTISVEEALATPGALVFKFPHEPIPGEGRQEGSHVAISLGNGMVLEAASAEHGVRIAPAGDRFGYAALIPGLDYAGDAPAARAAPVDPLAKPVDAPPPPQPSEPSPTEAAPVRAGERDSDDDALADFYEITYGLSPEQPDTDGDGITDGYELIMLGTRADLADTDFDQMADGLEIALGFDPLVADNPDAGVPLLVPEALHVDSDGDGIIDWGEELGGTDPDNSDTDLDGLSDGEELMLGGITGQADA